MSRIRSKGTGPELIVRRLVHRMGYRFRLHRADLPGRPDLILPRHRKVILVHGCFWHLHSCRYGRVVARTNATYWRAKRQRTVHRDRESIRRLREMGWRVLVIWECWTKNPAMTERRLRRFLATD